MTQRRKARRRPWPKGPILLVAFAACVLWIKPMGLLLWARIRILTNVPRTAIADPDARPEDPAVLGALRAEPLALPAAPSRDPFAFPASDGRGRPDANGPANPHDPHTSTPSDSTDGAGEAKSTDRSTDEPEAEGSGGSARASSEAQRVSDGSDDRLPDLPLAALAVRMVRAGC